MSSLAPALAGKSKKSKKNKERGKLKDNTPVQVTASKSVEGHGKNEGHDPNWAYKPPDGMVVLDTSQVDDDFDWDSLNNDENKELWIVRVPEGFKTKLLDGLEVQQPLAAPGVKLSTLERKRSKYDIWSVEHSSSTENPKGDEQTSMGEEIKKLSCLLPRAKKHGKFYLAPKQISQHIIVVHSSAVPNIDNSIDLTPSTRDSVPKNLLKHRFLPFGASQTRDGIRPAADLMDVDEPNAKQGEADDRDEKLPKKPKHSQTPQTAGKKRKGTTSGETETPTRKPKKMKI